MTPATKKGRKMDSRLASHLSKSQTKLNYSAKREQNRRFGEYNGEDGLEQAANTQSIWTQSACKLKLHILYMIRFVSIPVTIT